MRSIRAQHHDAMQAMQYSVWPRPPDYGKVPLISQHMEPTVLTMIITVTRANRATKFGLYVGLPNFQVTHT